MALNYFRSNRTCVELKIQRFWLFFQFRFGPTYVYLLFFLKIKRKYYVRFDERKTDSKLKTLVVLCGYLAPKSDNVNSARNYFGALGGTQSSNNNIIRVVSESN